MTGITLPGLDHDFVIIAHQIAAGGQRHLFPILRLRGWGESCKMKINRSMNARYLVVSTKKLLIQAIEEVPEPFLMELLDYVQFLQSKIAREKLDVTILSESCLAKDWLKPEEDEAWQGL